MTLKGHNALCNANRAVLWLNGKSWGSAKVPSDRAETTSYKLSIVTMCSSAAVWSQFWMECSEL